MNKKGETPLMWTFSILLVALIIGSFITISNKGADSETVVQKNIASEIELMVQTLVVVDGNVVVEVPYDLEKYGLTLRPDKIEVLLEEEVDPITKTFILPDGYVSAGVVKGKTACLEKKGILIKLRECATNEIA